MPNLAPMQEAADRLGVSLRTVQNMLADGRLTRYKLAGGRTVRVDLDELDALFVAEQ